MEPKGADMRLVRQASPRTVAPSTVGTGSERTLPSRSARPLTQETVLTEIVPDMTRRIVDAVHPVRVILFGSAARGQMGPDSDLDVLVVMPDEADQNQASKAIYRSLRGLGFATDALVVGESDLSLHGDDPWLIYRNALTEGRELYHVEG